MSRSPARVLPRLVDRTGAFLQHTHALGKGNTQALSRTLGTADLGGAGSLFLVAGWRAGARTATQKRVSSPFSTGGWKGIWGQGRVF